MDSSQFCETGIAAPILYMTKQRLTVGKAVHLASLRSKWQSQDLNSLLYDSQTHVVIDPVINCFIYLFWLQLTSLFCL